VNAEKLERFASIPEEERRLAENLLFNSPPVDAGDESLRTAPEDWREQTRSRRRPSTSSTSPPSPSISGRRASARSGRAEDLPLDERLANYIIEGSKDGLIEDLDRKRPRARRRSTSSTGR
jgi:5-methyltetrahydrofolate--homocysteine methyltransferase